MMPSCDQTGVPLHFHSSTACGSACWMSLRILLRVSPRQSPSSTILFEMSSDAGCSWLALDFFMFLSWEFGIFFICVPRSAGSALSDRAFRNKSSQEMAFPHPKSRDDNYRNEDLPNSRGVLGDFLERTIDISEDREAESDVNPAKDQS